MNIIARTLSFACALALAGPALAVTAGQPAPSCPLPTLDGSRTLDPAQFKGKVAYVDFWASWCGPCAASFPFMNQLHNELKAQGLEILTINLDEELDDAKNFLKRFPAEFTVVSDTVGKCPTLYGVQAMPTSFIIDKQGVVRHVHMGFRDSDKAAIRQHVEALLQQP
jgi:thiol-disulfide isomerase/thioredoxin